MIYVGMEDVCKSFEDFTASDHISFEVEKGSLTALLGPSGGGKTTILRLLAGLERADQGRIYVGGRVVNDIPPADRGIGFVFQNYALFRYMSVYDNIAFGLKVKKLPARQIRQRVGELIELTGLSGLDRRFPDELSGGQRQRVAFARALAPSPELLLLDEPFAAIDAKVRKELRQWLRDMIHQVGITSIFVTHDQDEAAEVADSIVIINQGRIEQMGPAREIYKKPRTPFASEFIGDSITIENFAGFSGFDTAAGARVILRPEFVEAFKPDNRHFQKILHCSEEGVITDILFRGNFLEVKLNVRGMTLTTHRSLERRPIRIGDAMRVIIYRLFLISQNEVSLLKNEALRKLDPNQEQMEASFYSDGEYYQSSR